LKQYLGPSTDFESHCHSHEPHAVRGSYRPWPEVISQTQMLPLLLPWEGKAKTFRQAVRFINDQVISRRGAGEKAVDDRRAQDVFLDAQALEPFQRRIGYFAHLSFVFTRRHVVLAKLPLSADESAFVEKAKNLGERNVRDDLASQEGRLGHG